MSPGGMSLGARTLVVHRNGIARLGAERFACTLGTGGVRRDKREGDGVTPVGLFPLRRLFFRADRLPRPATRLPAIPLRPDHGWCDDPADPAYNRFVRLPYPGRHERLWRDDRLYDLVLVIGHNDRPVRPSLGSAVFVHVMNPDGAPTAGCVAFAEADLLTILAHLGPGDAVRITDSAAN